MSERVGTAVIILVLVLGAGLLLTAVTRVQRAANQMACQNNIRQISIALLNYYDSYGSFPAGTVPNNNLPIAKRLSWLYAIDPFVESRGLDAPVWKEKNTAAWDAEDNSPRVCAGLRVYLCPANPNRTEPGTPSLTHYVGIAGLGEEAAELLKDDRRAGVFGYDRRTKLEDITDGVSRSMMLAETALDNGCWAAGGPATVRGLDTNRQPYLGEAKQFGGTHPGETVTGFADGSVHVLSDSMSHEVLEALVTMAGGEALPEALP